MISEVDQKTREQPKKECTLQKINCIVFVDCGCGDHYLLCVWLVNDYEYRVDDDDAVAVVTQRK